MAVVLFTQELSLQAQVDLQHELVSYWPLDAAEVTTPDITTNANHFSLVHTGPSDLVPGVRGNAWRFNGTNALLTRVDTDNTDLPIYQSTVYTVTLWVKGDYRGQNDRRVFSISSNTNNFPLLTIGTHKEASHGGVDVFIRSSSGDVALDHRQTSMVAFDGTWHHIAWTDSNGVARLYVDGVADASNFNYTRKSLIANTTSIGAVLRTNAVAFFNGIIDEVAIWRRVLSPAEIQELILLGLPFPPNITRQPADTDAFEGEHVILSTGVSGQYPFVYQWRKDGTDLMHATNESLVIKNIKLPDAGSYSVAISSRFGSVVSSNALLSVRVADTIVSGLLAQWPMDAGDNTTPDGTTNRNELTLFNMSADELVPGKSSNAFSFNGTDALLARVHTNSTAGGLPAHAHPAYTVSLWVKGSGLGQADRRVFAEASTTAAGMSDEAAAIYNNPVFTIGTDRDGLSGAVDILVRNQDGTTPILHLKSSRPAFDGAWHHIVWVDNNGSAVLYVDAARDSTEFSYTRGFLNLDVTSIGGILRREASHWFNGLIDEVAVWGRPLSEGEVSYVMTYGCMVPELRIIEIKRNRLVLTLAFVTPNPKGLNEIEESSSVTSPLWKVVQNAAFDPAEGHLVRVQILAPGDSPRFYRVVTHAYQERVSLQKVASGNH